MKIKKAFLISAFILVSTIGLLYGVDPQWFASTFLDLPQLDKNIAHIQGSYVPVSGLGVILALFSI